jgi:FlaA1/EpsC-like NDP-sugar epimerase
MDQKHRQKMTDRKFEHWQLIALCLMVCDFLSIHISYFLALWVRFDCVYSAIPSRYLQAYLHTITIYAAGAIVFFWFFKMYRSVWRYASYSELIQAFIGSACTSLIYIILISVLFGRMPLSYYLWGSSLQFIFLVVPRFSYRLLLFMRAGMKHTDETAGRVMIIGAGQAGQMLLRDLKTAKERHFLRTLGSMELSLQSVMDAIDTFLQPVWHALTRNEPIVKPNRSGLIDQRREIEV